MTGDTVPSHREPDWIWFKGKITGRLEGLPVLLEMALRFGRKIDKNGKKGIEYSDGPERK